VASEIAEQVRLLDGLLRDRFWDNAEQMGAWASARNPSLRSGRVVLGPFKAKGTPEVPRARSRGRRDGSAGFETTAPRCGALVFSERQVQAVLSHRSA